MRGNLSIYLENDKMTQLNTLSAAVRLCVATLAIGVIGSAAAASGTSRVIVAFKDGSAAKVRNAVAAARGSVKLEITDTNAMAVELPTAALKGLAANPNVEYVEEDVKRYPFALANASASPYQPGQVVPYGITMVQADQLPDTNAGSRMVCIIDSGYNLAHEDLSGNIVTGEYDAKGTGWWHDDTNSHGTHVAGTIAAVNNSGTGVVGVMSNKKVRLHIVKVFGADGWAYSSSLAKAAKLCGKAGANVVSMSLGGGTPSRTEMQAFIKLQAKGVLSIAAAGNDGDSTISYPAGYPSVMMVGAVDSNKNWANFSQYNSKVEIAGPGVDVLSTVPMNFGSAVALTVGGAGFTANPTTGTPQKTAGAALADMGLGLALDPAMAGKVCLIKRGEVSFAVKVSNCQNSGGVGAVLWNNVPEAFWATLGGTVTSIPSASVSGVDGALLMGRLGQGTTLAITGVSYEYASGTSMATPHVAGVAALVWSYFPSCNGEQIRATLRQSAQDLGDAGRDDKYGYGLVQAKAAYDRIRTKGCGN
jgi:subtilisin family serine protease